MKKVELLSPAGNMDSLKQAIHNGCDAVYLSGKSYGARHYAANFSNEELDVAVKYSHLYGVRVYVTVNTLVFDSEVESVLDYISYLTEIGVDALIMQDIGLIKMVRDIFPDMEVHASTQCHNDNEECLKLFKDLGVKRVVLDRELELDEIKKYKTDIETEVFVYGALCVSYSGCCLFSSMNGSRSANRGMCVASCRLPYKLEQNNKLVKTKGDYLLSMKELNTLNHIPELIDAGITSFKIEGRMKSPEYVGYVTHVFRKMIDKYYNNEESILDSTTLTNLEKLYNRKFTSGYLFKDKDISNIKSPNHIGTNLGKVIDVSKKYIKIKLNDDLNMEDGIRLPNDKGMIVNYLYNDKGLLVNSIKKNEIAVIDNKVNLKDKGNVIKTVDKKLVDEINNYEEKKIPVDIEVIAKNNHPLTITISDGINKVTKEGIIVSKSIKNGTDKTRIISQVSKLGNTCFKLNKIESDIDKDIFIPISSINSLRRDILDELEKIRMNKKRNIVKKDICFNDKKLDKDLTISVLVRNEEQLLTCLDLKISRIYTDSYSTYNKYKDKENIYLRLPRVINKFNDYNNERLVVREYGALNKYHLNNEVICDYTMNVTNKMSLRYLSNYSSYITLSPEVDDIYLDRDYNSFNAVYFVYGRVEVMITKYCLLKNIINDNKDNCNICMRKDKYYLVDKDNNRYPILNTIHFMHIYNKEVTDNTSNIKKCLKAGIKSFHIELFDEEKDDITKLVSKIRGECHL